MSRLQENTTANQHWKNKHVSQSLSSVESGCCGEIQSSNIPFNRPYVHNTLRVCSPINISRLVCVSCSCLLLVSCTLFFIIVEFFFFSLCLPYFLSLSSVVWAACYTSHIFHFQESLLHLTPQSPNLPSHADVFKFPLYSLTSHLKPTSGSLFFVVVVVAIVDASHLSQQCRILMKALRNSMLKVV